MGVIVSMGVSVRDRVIISVSVGAVHPRAQIVHLREGEGNSECEC